MNGEDTHVGFALHCARIPLVHDFRYVYQGDTPPEVNRSKYSIHLNDRGTAWNPAIMRSTHFEQELGRKKYPGWNGTCKKDGTTFVLLHPRGPRCKQCGTFV